MTYSDHFIDQRSIRLKRSFESGDVPATGALRPGEIAVNVADACVFMADETGTVQRIGASSQIVSSGDISSLTEAQQGSVTTGSIVTTTDGRRWLYKGSGDKDAEGSYIELADITPVWTVISGKPSEFPPAAHGHTVADVTGLQTALDGKQTAGSYAPASHAHTIADVTALQTALDGKQAAGSYALSTHTHAINDVTGLQTALDGKAAAGHTHAYSELTGAPTLATVATSGSYDDLTNKPAIVKAAVEWTSNHTIADGTRYLAGDVVYAGGNIYVALYDNESIPVTSATYWQNLGPGYRLNIDGRDIQNIPGGGGGVSLPIAIADVTGLQTALDGKQASGSYAASTHTHAIADVTGLQTALDGKQASGSYASATHTHSASDITSGTISAARLGSGTASASTYLRGDGTWATPAGGGSSGPTVVSASYASTLATDASAGDIFDVTLTGNVTLANPTNPTNGKTIRWRITQDATGGRTVTLGNKFSLPASVSSLEFSTAAAKTDILAATYHQPSDRWQVVALVTGY